VKGLVCRKLIPHLETRRLLERYSGYRDTKTFQPLKKKEFRRLRSLLLLLSNNEASAPGSLAALLDCWHPGSESASEQDTFTAPEAVAAVLYHLGSCITSDTALLQGQHAADALQQLIAADWLDKLEPAGRQQREAEQGTMQHAQQGQPTGRAVGTGLAALQDQLGLLHQDASSLFNMLSDLQGDFMSDPAWKGHISDILTCLLRLWDQHLRSPAAEHSKSVLISGLEPDDAARAIIEKQQLLAWYPNWPLLYTRPRYEGLEQEDGRSKDKSAYTKCDGGQKKESPGQRKFNPGIFKVTCVHGVVYGFHFMKEPESPSDLFTMLLTRWPRGRLLPALLWYDNMCKAYEYIIKREPWMLKFMRALVDSFHYGSALRIALHKCPQCFNTQAHMVAELFNSQYEEHGNAFLSVFRRSARTMGLQRALQLIAMLLRKWNGSKARKMERKFSTWREQYELACRALRWQ
jgi:hypothetical protein